MTIKEQKAQIAKYEERRGELLADIESAKESLAAARSGIVSGEADAADKATTAQARITALGGAVEELDARLSAAHDELARSERSVEVERTLATMKGLAEEAQRQEEALRSANVAVREAFEAAVEAISTASMARADAARRYQSLRDALPEVNEHDARENLDGMPDPTVPTERVNLGKYGQHLGQALHHALSEEGSKQLRANRVSAITVARA